MEGVAKLYYLNKNTDTKNTHYDPQRYLGTNVGKFEPPGGSVTASFMSQDDYVEEAVNKVSTKMSEAGITLDGKSYSVMRTGYNTELDLSAALNDDQENYYQKIIGVLRWYESFDVLLYMLKSLYFIVTYINPEGAS